MAKLVCNMSLEPNSWIGFVAFARSALPQGIRCFLQVDLRNKLTSLRTFSIEWQGTTTREIGGWESIKAYSQEEAHNMFLQQHGQTRRIRGISEVLEGAKA